MERGARVAILLNNSVDAVLADQAVLANGLIPVPLHAIDTPGFSAFILIDSQSSTLITNKADRWGLIEKTNVPMPDLKHVILTEETGISEKDERRQILSKDIWLASGKDIQELPEGPKPEDLAAIVQHNGPLGITTHNIHIVGNKHHRNATLFIDGSQIFHHALFFQSILTIGNFVQNQGTGIQSQGRSHT